VLYVASDRHTAAMPAGAETYYLDELLARAVLAWSR
jgi:hypothetical protein